MSISLKNALPVPASRRSFLKHGALTALAASALGACRNDPDNPKVSTKGTSPDAMDHSGGTTAPNPAPPKTLDLAAARRKADEMDAMHEKGIKAFPAKTAGKGNQLFAPRVERGVKVFELTAKPLQWEVAPGQMVEGWAYNGQVPGPQIRVREGDRVRVVLHNELPESTAIHFHGLELPNQWDGVPFITQPPVKPGESYTYEFVVPNSGSHMNHSHHNSAKQVGLGLLGAFIVSRRRPPRSSAPTSTT